MALIVDAVLKVFDTAQLKKGDLLYAKHESWPEGKGGFVTAVCADELTIQYHPGIGNAVNHFFIPAGEAAAGEWEMRWSEDLKNIHEYGMKGGDEDAAGRADSKTPDPG